MASVVAARYAGALFELAEEKKVRREVAEGLMKVHQALAQDPARTKTLFDRRTELAEKRRLAVDVLAGQSHVYVKNILGLLIDRHRETEIRNVILAFFERSEAADGILRVEIETAQALDSAALARLTQGIENVTKNKVAATTKVLPELLGGIRLVIGSRRLDGSLKRKIEKLAERLHGAV